MRLVDEHGVVLPAGYMAEHRLGFYVTHEGGEPVVVVRVFGLRRSRDSE
jgi:hypothetical protein